MLIILQNKEIRPELKLFCNIGKKGWGLGGNWDNFRIVTKSNIFDGKNLPLNISFMRECLENRENLPKVQDL